MDAPARYVAQKLDPNALAIRDTKHDLLYMMFVTEVYEPLANYRITIARITQSEHPYFMFEQETFSVNLFCARESVLQALVRSMLSFMCDTFEIAAPSEFAFLMGGDINNSSIPLPPRRQRLN